MRRAEEVRGGRVETTQSSQLLLGLRYPHWMFVAGWERSDRHVKYKQRLLELPRSLSGATPSGVTPNPCPALLYEAHTRQGKYLCHRSEKPAAFLAEKGAR